MSPDPPVDQLDRCLEISYSQDVILAPHSSDDSDNDVEAHQGYDGYTLLGQNDIPGGPLDSDQEDSTVDESRSDTNGLVSQPSQGEPLAPPPAGRIELVALWNSTSSSTTDIDMNAEKSEQVRAAMAGFSLPASAVPPWAADIPEEQWKQRLLARLQTNGKDLTPVISYK